MRRPSGEKTKRLNVFLLKNGITNFDDALASPQSWANNSIPMKIAGFDAILYAKSKPGGKADWITMLESGIPVGQTSPFTNAASQNHSALLLLKIKGKFFALAFGHGRTFLKADSWEPRFGLRIALNLADASNIQLAAFKSHEGRTLTREVSSSRLTGFYDLGFDGERDFVRKITAKLKNNPLGLRITGKDSVSLVCPVKLAELPDKCRRLRAYAWYDGYKSKYPEIDNVIMVDDRPARDALFGQLETDLAGTASKIHFAIPEIIDYERYAGVKLEPDNDLIDDLSIATIKAELGIDPISLTDLKSATVVAEDDLGAVLGSWTLLNCCIAEVTYQGATYLLSEGDWFKCDQAYIQGLNQFVNGIPQTNLLAGVPRNGESLENPYLEALATRSDHSFLVAHKQNVMYGGGQNKIEVCDLLKFANPIMLAHIKGGGGATEFGHLALQGQNSLELLIDDDASFRTATLTKLANRAIQNGVTLPLSLPENGSDYRVVFGLFCDPNLSPSQAITLFGKISLRRAAKTLRKFGCAVSLELMTP